MTTMHQFAGTLSFAMQLPPWDRLFGWLSNPFFQDDYHVTPLCCRHASQIVQAKDEMSPVLRHAIWLQTCSMHPNLMAEPCLEV